MGDDSKGDAAKRTTPEMRKASLLLSGLVLTPDSALDAFRKRRAADPELDDAHLRRARDLLDAIADALTSTDDEKWKRIERAWDVIQGNKPGLATPAPPASAVAGPASGSAPASAPSSAAPATPGPTATPAPDASPASVPAAPNSGPAPPPPVGTPLPEDQAPPAMAAAKPSASPWAKPAPQPAVAPPPVPASAPARPPSAPAPNAPATPAVTTSASRSAAENIGIDVEALNKIKLDSDEIGTLPADAVFASKKPLPFNNPPNAPPKRMDHPERDPLGETRTAFHDLDFVNQPIPFDAKAPDSFQPTERLDTSKTPELPQHLAHMTLEQYAALCAECTVSPEWTQQIHARYGIRSPEDRKALDNHWQSHILGNANVANTYKWHYARYEEWAKSRSQS
jgi:hypothetical protein